MHVTVVTPTVRNRDDGDSEVQLPRITVYDSENNSWQDVSLSYNTGFHGSYDYANSN